MPSEMPIVNKRKRELIKDRDELLGSIWFWLLPFGKEKLADIERSLELIEEMIKHHCPTADSQLRARVTGLDYDTWRIDDTCSYCGSLHPDHFMERVEAGDCTLTPTDKNYKVYISNDGGDQFQQEYRDTPAGRRVMRLVSETKFYWYHLNEDQMFKFFQMYQADQINDDNPDPNYKPKLKLKFPGHFYRLPYFMKADA